MLPDLKKRAMLGRWIAFALVIIILGGYMLYTMRANITSSKPREVAGYERWSDDVIDIAADLPIQDGGRVKPFSTWAGFALLKMNGDRSVKISNNKKTIKLGPEEVLLDCLFRPEVARELPIFRIDDSHVISELATNDLPPEIRRMAGMDSHTSPSTVIDAVLKGKNRRDRYSYNELEPVAPLLIARAQELQKKDKANGDVKLTEDEKKTTDLASKLWMFLQLSSHMDFARANLKLQNSASLQSESQQNMRRVSTWLVSLPEIASTLRKMEQTNGRLPPHIVNLFSEIQLRITRSSEGLRFIPSYDGKETWSHAGKRMTAIVDGKREHIEPLVKDMKILEDAHIALQNENQKKFGRKLAEFKESAHSNLDKKTVSMLGTEVSYVRMQYFYRALIVFLFAFLCTMFSWLSPRSLPSRILTWLTVILTVSALLLIIAGITHRCIIMNRSPIGNLYDTILFIAGTGVLVLLLVELLTRRMVALGLAVFMGLACMFLARRFEMGDAQDHMDPLVAVLKSNFWLSTHVVTVTIGYMGGLASAGVSVIYLFARVLGIDMGDKSFRRAVTRIAYGLVCFTLFFSLIGTVLGGIWANDSWGRFWGWDPKENGALMIVLWSLAVLHARLAGYLREWGLHIALVFGANIVAFSWWHVNALETGLHNYGFIKGMGAVWGFYWLNLAVCLMGGIAAIVTRFMPQKALPPELPESA